MSIRQMIKDKKEEFFGAQSLETRTKKLREERKEIQESNKRRDDYRSEKKQLRQEQIKDLAGRFGITPKTKRSPVMKQSSGGFGRGFGAGINPAFSLGKEKPKEKKKDIVIRIKQ